MAKKGKKKCSKCGKFFDPRGIKRHEATCKVRLAPKPLKGPKKKVAPKKVKKDRFIIFDRDQTWFSEASTLQRAEDLASEMLENDVRADEISVFKVVEEYKVEKVRKAHLTKKSK